MTIEMEAASKRAKDVSLDPKRDEISKRLTYLDEQLDAYPECDLSATEMLMGIFELQGAVLSFWSPEASELREDEWLPKVIERVQKHLDLSKMSEKSKRAALLLSLLKSETSTGPNLKRDHAAVLGFKLGLLFGQLDHEVAEKEAAAKSRHVLNELHAPNGPQSAKKRTWWKSHVRPHLQRFMEEYPNVKNAKFAAEEILPKVNEGRKKYTPVSLERLTREVRLIFNNESTKI